MDLFSSNPISNILSFDGEVKYYGSVMNTEKSQYYFDQLLQHIQWKNDKAIIFGKLIITKRKVAWYGDKPFDYTYSKTTKSALPWTKELLELKEIIENKTGEKFNSCLLNLYHNGAEGMVWHSDGEKDLKKNGAIGSLSFGAERKFSFKHRFCPFRKRQFIGNERRNTNKLASPFTSDKKSKKSENKFNL